jgi:hypothetical protein
MEEYTELEYLDIDMFVHNIVEHEDDEDISEYI